MSLLTTVTARKLSTTNSLCEMLQHGAALVTTFIIVLLANVFLANATAAAEPTAQLSDKEITNTITDELLLDPGISSQRIVVDTDNDIVTLSGAVNNILAKDRAVKIAETVKGVRSVINQIQVIAQERPDQAIIDDIKAALHANPRTESFEIKVTANEGKVTLTGTMQSWQEKELAGKVVKSIKGVREVDNQMTVVYSMEWPDDEIKEDIVGALRWDRLVDDALIDVAIQDGAVALSGTVGSAAEKRRARNDAWVAGVKSVDFSGLGVAHWARSPDLRKDKYVTKSDPEIREVIQGTLRQDPRTSSLTIDVIVAHGIVTLRGNVDNLASKRAAAQDARNIIGVWRVKNRLRVQPSELPSDSGIAAAVRDALLRDPFVERYEITPTANQGQVTLTGMVDTYFEKARAEDVVSQLEGVVDVNNNLTVADQNILTYDPYIDETYTYDYSWYDYRTNTTVSDWEIRQDIIDKLQWSPYIDSEQVTVAVENGIAILAGTVDTWSERSAATEHALQGGAIRVINKLTIEYGPDFELF